MKPKQSLLVPESEPSGRTTTQLMAPIWRATSSVSSTIESAFSLCGMVRLQPAKLSAGSARNAALEAVRPIASST